MNSYRARAGSTTRWRLVLAVWLVLELAASVAAKQAEFSAERYLDSVKFLASEEASYITGHVLAVNGGMYM